MNPEASLAVVIPTRNAGRTLERCLVAARTSPAVAEIVVVDNESSDDTRRIAERAGVRCIAAGPERSAQRNVGLAAVSAPIVAFLDADQIVQDGLVEEAAALIAGGADAVILRERTVGRGTWAAIRAWERTVYDGDDEVEAARVFRRDLVSELGGFDEALSAFEDWDLTIRARTAGATIARTQRWVLHDEDGVTLTELLRKKRYYGAWTGAYRAKHPVWAARQLSPRSRGMRLLRSAPRLLRRPLLGAGVFVLKALEFAASRTAHGRSVSASHARGAPDDANPPASL